jgi:hypothetical protein
MTSAPFVRISIPIPTGRPLVDTLAPHLRRHCTVGELDFAPHYAKLTVVFAVRVLRPVVAGPNITTGSSSSVRTGVVIVQFA